MTPTETELKPCPFCGRKPSVENTQKGTFIGCNVAGCPATSRLYNSNMLAIEQWNTRADLQQPTTAQGAAIRKALEGEKS